jgi:hypothetical protein
MGDLFRAKPNGSEGNGKVVGLRDVAAEMNGMDRCVAGSLRGNASRKGQEHP